MANISNQNIVPELNVNLSGIPALIDLDGINKHLFPLSRAMAYQLASAGQIESASLGIGRGRRVFVTSSVVDWMKRRMAQSRRPNCAPRKKEGSNE